MGLWSDGHRVEVFEVFFISMPERIIQGGDGGVHPGVKDILTAFQGTTAFRTGLNWWFVNGGIHIAILGSCENDLSAFFTFPEGDRGGEVPLSANHPVPFK